MMNDYYVPTYSEAIPLRASILDTNLVIGRPAAIRRVYPNLMAALWLRHHVQIDGDNYILTGRGYNYWRKRVI